MEEEFGIDIREDDVQVINTVQDIINIVKLKKNIKVQENLNLKTTKNDS